MNFHYLFDSSQPLRRNRFWALTLLSAFVIAVNGITLREGITIVFSQLFYFPIILAGYWYPRKGILFSTGIAAVYAGAAVLFGPADPFLLVAIRCEHDPVTFRFKNVPQ
jgi:hypothetical protein